MSIVYEEDIRIRAFDCGTDGLARPAAIADYLQDMATEHARRLGFSCERMLAENLAWVLARIYFRMEQFPACGETVTFRTWPRERDKYTAIRDFTITGEDGAELGRATSQWVTLDIKARKMASLPDYLEETYLPHEETALSFNGRSIPRLKEGEREVRVTALDRDMDMNGHVNNVHYLEWALEALPAGVRNGGRLVSADISFRAESMAGDELVAACAPQGDGSWLHAIRHAADGREAARVLTVWDQKS